MPQAARKKSADAPSTMAVRKAAKVSKGGGRRIQVRRSGVHGRGVYAVAEIAMGEVIVEYTGERIDWEEAMDRHPHDPASPTTPSTSAWTTAR